MSKSLTTQHHPLDHAPTIAVTADRINIEWPNGRGPTMVPPEVIEGWATQVNTERARNTHLRTCLEQILDDITEEGWELKGASNAIRIAREALAGEGQ